MQTITPARAGHLDAASSGTAATGTGPVITVAPERLTGEDLTRGTDRARVRDARSGRRRWTLIWLLTGPGVLAMLGENDGPSMISYTEAGARYGTAFFLPLILVLFAMAFVCQEMCMRIGAVTHRGYGQLVLERFGRVWGWFGAGDLALTNVITLISEFVAIRIGLSFFGVGPWVAAGLGVGLVVLSASGGRYWRWERVLLGLAVFNLLFVAAAVLAHHHGSAPAPAVGGGGVHTLLLLLASTIGATITPWMVFFQQSACVDKGMTSSDIGHGRLDTAIGAVLAAACGCGALYAGAAIGGSGLDGLAGSGIPAALAHTSGHSAATIFALGMVEAGALATLTISASTAYAAGECVGATHSFNAGLRGAPLFHAANLASALIAASVILIPGAPLVSIALNANVLATVLAPVSLVFVLLLANDRQLMGENANRRAANTVGVAVVALVVLCGTAYAIDSFVQTL